MNRIVVGVDGSEASRLALRWAAQEARLRNATLHVVHAWSAPYDVPGPTPLMEARYSADTAGNERRMAEDLVERELGAISGHLAGIPVERDLTDASAAEALLKAAETSELLVLGSSRHGTLADVILGAVGQECIRHARCPVVTVRSNVR